ncbi:MspA family porin [Nocardia terpenica]|uniref:Uncharacterized protein n=1 Tax=Nocardia terpenica TaxID=455432 RepID=A0A161XGC0_9NOCA|nr:MspA family porin [Nocardia terpenica]KZM72528.1 hypothetical protein AWN90_27355 [Nocardia terpenica]
MHHRATRYALSTAVVVGGTVIAAALAPVAAAEQGQSSTLQSEGGTELTVAVDDTDTVGAGNQAPGGVPFSHSVQVAGRYSVDVHPEKITSGTVAVGYILGCGGDLLRVDVDRVAARHLHRMRERDTARRLISRADGIGVVDRHGQFRSPLGL